MIKVPISYSQIASVAAILAEHNYGVQHSLFPSLEDKIEAEYLHLAWTNIKEKAYNKSVFSDGEKELILNAVCCGHIKNLNIPNDDWGLSYPF